MLSLIHISYVADGHWRKTGHDASRTVSQVALDYRAKVVGLYRSLGDVYKRQSIP